MTVYSPTAVALGNLTLPADGETVEAADVNVPLSAIADAVKFLEARALSSTRLFPCGLARGITASGGAYAAVAPSIGPEFTPLTSADVRLSTTNVLQMVRVSTSTTLGPGVFIPLDLEHGSIIQDATLYYTPATTLSFGSGTPRTLLPTHQPRLGIVRLNLNSAEALLSTGSGFVEGAAANIAAYVATQTLTFTPNQNATVDNSLYSYAAVVFDEHGTNACQAGQFFGVRVRYSGVSP